MAVQPEAAQVTQVTQEHSMTQRDPAAMQRFAGAQEQREWLFAGADELFRGLYTRAGIGFSSEVLAVSSAIAGEGKTTVSLGLAVAVAQDYPERRGLGVGTR